MDLPERNDSKGSLIEPFQSPKARRRRLFNEFDGGCLDLIAGFIGERLPPFVFVNKRTFDTFFSYQNEVNEISKGLQQSNHSSPKLKQSDVFEI